MLRSRDTSVQVAAAVPVTPLRPRPSDELELVFDVPGGRAAPNAARRVLLEHDERLPTGVRADLLLLLSELVSNAVLHGRVGPEASIGVHVHGRDRTVRVEVTDPGAGFDWERRRRERPRREGGFGLALVERIAERWGIERQRGRTHVWFEIRTPGR